MTPSIVTEFQEAESLFGYRIGSIVATKITFIPHRDQFGSGCRSFPASDFDEMVSWMLQYCPNDLRVIRETLGFVVREIR